MDLQVEGVTTEIHVTGWIMPAGVTSTEEYYVYQYQLPMERRRKKTKHARVPLKVSFWRGDDGSTYNKLTRSKYRYSSSSVEFGPNFFFLLFSLSLVAATLHSTPLHFTCSSSFRTLSHPISYPILSYPILSYRIY